MPGVSNQVANQALNITSSPEFNTQTLNNLVFNFETIVANNTFPSVILTAANIENQHITFSAPGDGVQIELPNATTLVVGKSFNFTAVNSPGGVFVSISSTGFTYSVALQPDTGVSQNVIFTLLDNSTSDGVWCINMGLPINSFPIPASAGGTGLSTITYGAALIGNASGSWDQIGSIPSASTFGGMLQWGNDTKVRFITSSARGQPYTSGSAVTTSGTFAVYGLPFGQSANQLLYFNTAFQVLGLASANNGILVTSAAGVPSIGNTVGAGLTMPSITFNSTSGIIGTTTNNNAAAGSVGEVVPASVDVSGAVSLSTATNANITSISLTAGDWDVMGLVGVTPAATTNITQVFGWISATSATLPGSAFYTKLQYPAAGAILASTTSFVVPTVRISVASTTTVYLSVRASFTVDTLGGFGSIYARRSR